MAEQSILIWIALGCLGGARCVNTYIGYGLSFRQDLLTRKNILNFFMIAHVVPTFNVAEGSQFLGIEGKFNHLNTLGAFSR